MAAASHTLGAILAGGEGRRVGGEDKGLLPLRGRPLVAHVLDALRLQCDALLVVANRNLDEYSRLAMTVADERLGQAGPLAGIEAALAATNDRRGHALGACEWLLTVPVDCPRPPPDLRRRLQSALSTSDAPCAFAHDDCRAQPLFALYRLADAGTLLAGARAALDSHASVLRWHADIGASAVDFSGPRAAFHNLNTPQDFRDCEGDHHAG